MKLLSRGICAAGLMWIAGAALAGQGPTLRCDFSAAGEDMTLSFRPVDNPYTVPVTPITHRFGFKAVLLRGKGSALESVILYAYATGPEKPLLLQRSHYADPLVADGQDRFALTGHQTVYSPGLERVLSYGCVLLGENHAP